MVRVSRLSQVFACRVTRRAESDGPVHVSGEIVSTIERRPCFLAPKPQNSQVIGYSRKARAKLEGVRLGSTRD